MSKRNPYTVAEKVLSVTGNILVGILTTVAIAICLEVLVSYAWPHWGAWALTVPILVLAAGAVCVFVFALVINFSAYVAHRWNAAKYNWNNGEEEPK